MITLQITFTYELTDCHFFKKEMNTVVKLISTVRYGDSMVQVPVLVPYRTVG